MKISVAGTGYVGLSIATLLAQHHTVTAVDIVPERVEMVNNKKSPIQDDYIEEYLANKPLDLRATLDWEAGYRDAEFVVIAAPTNYDSTKNFFDTSAVEDVIDKVLKVNPAATMVIKSTIPVGYTRSVREKFSCRERQADGTVKVVRARPCTTSSTRAASLWVTTSPRWSRRRTPSRPSSRRAPSKRRCPCSSWAAPKPRP